MTLSILPYELLQLLLETSASLPATTLLEAQKLTPHFLALAATSPTLHAIYHRFQLRIWTRHLRAATGSCYDMALELHWREQTRFAGGLKDGDMDLDTEEQEPEPNLPEIRQMLARHREVAVFAEYLELRSRPSYGFPAKIPIRFWIEAIYTYAVRGINPSLIAHDGIFHGWNFIIDYRHEAAFQILKRVLVENRTCTPAEAATNIKDLKGWLAGYGYASEEIIRWRVLGQLLGVWDGAVEVVRRSYFGINADPEVHQREYREFSEKRSREILDAYYKFCVYEEEASWN